MENPIEMDDWGVPSQSEATTEALPRGLKDLASRGAHAAVGHDDVHRLPSTDRKGFTQKTMDNHGQ